MACEFSLRTQAYFDREVDALSAVAVEAHLVGCAECRSLLNDLEAMRHALRSQVGFATAPVELRSKIKATLDGAAGLSEGNVVPIRVATPRRWFWTGAATGVLGSALAAGMALFLLLPVQRDRVVDSLITAHLNSMMPNHLIDVVSTDRHTVKPWLASHADVSPVVADFEAKGFRLIGGRMERLNQQRAAVVVYQHGAHVINVFSWASDVDRVPRDALRNGYRLAFWRQENLTYCAVSDVAWDAMSELERLMQATGLAEAQHE
jgi:anti-sigma factor RsiW